MHTLTEKQIDIRKGEELLAKADIDKVHELIIIKFEKKTRIGLSHNDKVILKYMDLVASDVDKTDSYNHS